MWVLRDIKAVIHVCGPAIVGLITSVVVIPTHLGSNDEGQSRQKTVKPIVIKVELSWQEYSADRDQPKFLGMAQPFEAELLWH